MTRTISSYVLGCCLILCVESYALEPEQEYRQMIKDRKPTSELRAFLLQHPTFVNIGNEEKETALHIGIWNGDTSFVNFLISLEVDLNQVDRNNHPPLLYACGECDLVMIKLLLQNGANTKGTLHDALMCPCDPQFHQSDGMISGQDSVDDSDLWTLREGRKTISTRILLGTLFEYGADPNEREAGSGNTILHELAEFGDLNLIEFVINQKAQTNLKNNEGNTPREIALSWIGRVSLASEDFFPLFEQMASDQESGNAANPATVRKIKDFLDDYNKNKNTSMFGAKISFFFILQKHGITNADFIEYGRCRVECTEQMKSKTNPNVDKRLKIYQALLVDVVNDKEDGPDTKSIVLIAVFIAFAVGTVIEYIRKIKQSR